MTYILPDFFLEEQKKRVIASDSLFCVSNSSRHTQADLSVRNVTHVMILLHTGQKHLKFANQTVSIAENSILLLSQGHYFMSEIVNGNALYEATLIFFDDGYIHSFLERHALQILDCDGEKTVHFAMDRLLKNLSDSYKWYLDEPIEKKAEILKLKTEELLLHLYANHKARFSAFVQTVLSASEGRIKYLLESNADLFDDVAHMGALTRLSKTQLRKSVQNLYGVNPKEWLDKKRMEKAALLLKTTDRAIHAIATDCGYATLSWFGSQFKTFYRLTPKEYREQNRY